MSDTEINIAIAGACGWKRAKEYDYMEAFPPSNKGHCFYEKDGQLKRDTELPDYCRDLNAMHEAEKWFDNKLDDERSMYRDYMALDAEGFPDTWECEWHCLRATAHQRAEAFLRTLGKWKK